MNKIIAALVVLTASLAGCAAPPVTSADPPSVVIGSTDKAGIKANLIARNTATGWTLMQESESLLVFTKPETDTTSSAVTQVLLGNRHSTKPVYEARYTLVQVPAGVLVVATVDVSTQLPGGQVQRMTMLDHQPTRQGFVAQLGRVRGEIER